MLMPRRRKGNQSTVIEMFNFLVISSALFFRQVSSLCEMGDLWLIKQFEPTNAQYWANWLNICPTQKIPCNGAIQEWNFYSTSDDGSPIYLSVWRQIEPNGFQLVGYNEVNATRIGNLRFKIEKDDRIRVRAGDVFGIFYEHRESTGSVGFIAGVGTATSATHQGHLLHSCLSQQFTKDEISQYMESNGRVILKGPSSKKLFMVQAVVHDEHEVQRVKPTEEPFPSCGPIPQVPNSIIVNYQPSGARTTGLLGDTIEFECRDTYKLTGPYRVRCNADQTWSETPVCEPTVFCQPPPFVENAYSSPPIVGKADIGTVVRYACEPGYAFAAQSQNGEGNFSLVVCQDTGYWTPAPKCNKVDSNCGLPPTVTFATAFPLYDTERKTAVFGDSVRYKCDPGYFMMGNDTITCGRDGRWSDHLPRCGGMYRLCDNKLPEVENAQVVYSSTEPFSVAFYICRQGFFGEGNRAHIRCLPDGSWEKPDYLCNRKSQHIKQGPPGVNGQQTLVGVAQCKNPPPQVENAIVIVRSTEPGAPATYLCLEDHRPFGNATVVCCEDGVWRGDPNFACIDAPTTSTTTPTTTTPMGCGTPPQIAHATGWQLYRGRLSVVGDQVKYLCADGYDIVGNVTVTCLQSGQWSSQPTCQPAKLECDWPPDIPNAVLVSNVDGLEASYECKEGFNVAGGAATLLCSEGQWSKPVFNCQAVQCSEPPIVRNAAWVPKGPANVGTVVLYECNSGTKMVGGDSIVCQTNGEWTNPPDCIEMISCGPPPNIPNTVIVSTVGMVDETPTAVTSTAIAVTMPIGTTLAPISISSRLAQVSSPGSSVTYACKEGYRLVSNRSTIYCQSDRKWSFPMPSCEATLYKAEYLAAFWPLSKRYGVRDISGHSFHGAAPILLQFQPATNGLGAPITSIAEFGPNRYVEIRHYRDQFNYAAKSFSYVMYLGPSSTDGPILEYDSVGGRLGFHIWIQAAQLYVYYEPKYYLYSGYTGNEIKSPKIDLRKWNFLASVYNFPSGTASLWLDDQKLAEKYVGHLYPEMSQGFYIGQHKRPTGDPRQFQGQQIACVAAYKMALEASDLVELKKLCIRLLADGVLPNGQKPPDGVMVSNTTERFTVNPAAVPVGALATTPRMMPVVSASALEAVEPFPPIKVEPVESAQEAMAREQKHRSFKAGIGFEPFNKSALAETEVAMAMASHNIQEIAMITTAIQETTTLAPAPTLPSTPQFPFANAQLMTTLPLSNNLPLSEPLHPSTLAGSAQPTADPMGPSCGRVPYVSNAMVSDGFSNGSSHVGDIATYRCFTGYQLVGEPTILCHAKGEWTTPPRCIDKLGGNSAMYPVSQCHDPGDIVNADLLFSNKTVGGLALYRCHHGFALRGSAITYCQSDGTWSEMPECRKVDCGKPPAVTNGDVRFHETSFGSQAFYTCNAGYQLQGFQIATCTETGVWFQIPVCHGSSCQPPAPVENGNIIPLRGDGRSPGSAFKVVCKANYRMGEHVNDTLICQPDGTWTKAPTCDEIECGGLPVIPNGIIRPPGAPHSGGPVAEIAGGEVNRAVRTVTVTCQTGFKLKGPSTMVCYGDGTWSQPPTCEQFSCDLPPIVEHATYNFTSLLPGSIVAYTCENGYRLSGNVEIRCSADGRWIGQAPTCREMLCHPPVLHPGTSFSYSSERLTVGTTVVFTCYNGSYLEGNNTALCQPNGQWSRMGRCLPVTCGLPPSVNNSFIVRLDGYNFSNSVVYSCKEGYTMAGSATVTCSAKGFWGDTPRCEPPPCSAPQLIDHGSVNFRTPLTAGSVASYACSPGYELIGSSNLTCLPSGQWNDLPPNCQPLACGNPPEIPNSMVTIFCNAEICTVGEKAIYECPPQWHLVGSPVVTCLPDRKWSHIPSCITKTARASESRVYFPHSNSGTFKRSRFFRTGQQATPRSASSTSSSYTEPNLDSTNMKTNVDEARRPFMEPGIVQSMSVEKSTRASTTELPSFLGIESIPSFLESPDQEQSNRELIDSEFMLNQQEVREDSSPIDEVEEILPWMELSTLPTDQVTCGQAPFVPNSLVSFSFVGDASRPGDTARYACSGNFQLRGPEIAVCLDSGHWSVVPACESPCPMLALQNGYVTYYNHSVQYTVARDNDKNGEEELNHGVPSHRSLNNLYLDEVLVASTAQTLDFNDEIANQTVLKEEAEAEKSQQQQQQQQLSDYPGSISSMLQFEFRYASSVHEGTVARFGCESSFDIVGAREAVCQKDGTWSAPVPRCTACYQMSVGNVPPAIVLNEVAYLMSPNLSLFLDMRFNCSGRLTSWVYYCRSREADQAAGVYLGVWRPTMVPRAPVKRGKEWQDRSTEYRLVGKTFVKPRQYGFNVHNLTDREAIDVKFGDIIGFHYAVPNIPARYLTIPIATQRDPWPFDASSLSRTVSLALTDRDVVRDENMVKLKHDVIVSDFRQIPAIKAVLSPPYVQRR